MTKVMCFGTFDGLHQGHLSYFKQAKKLGDFLIVIIARDKNVIKFKGREPREKELRRLKLVSQIKEVDRAVIGNQDDIYAVIKKFQPEIICLGYDQKADEKKLRKLFPDIKIVRLKSYQPNKFKSSILNK